MGSGADGLLAGSRLEWWPGSWRTTSAALLRSGIPESQNALPDTHAAPPKWRARGQIYVCF